MRRQVTCRHCSHLVELDRSDFVQAMRDHAQVCEGLRPVRPPPRLGRTQTRTQTRPPGVALDQPIARVDLVAVPTAGTSRPVGPN
jgi:hypothetical protein